MPRKPRPSKDSSTRNVDAHAASSPGRARVRAPAGDAGARARRGYAGRSAEQLRGERAARLLATALELFSARGYAKTPIEHLCAHARVTTRHFYEQFDSREALLAALYQRIVTESQRAVFTAFETPGLPPEQRLLAAAHAFVRSYTEDPRHARIACIEVVGVSEAISGLRRRMIAEFAERLEAAANALSSSGALPPRDYRLGALCIIGGTHELLTEWLTSASPPSVAELTEQLVRFCAALFAGARVLGPTTPGFDPRTRAVTG